MHCSVYFFLSQLCPNFNDGLEKKVVDVDTGIHHYISYTMYIYICVDNHKLNTGLPNLFGERSPKDM